MSLLPGRIIPETVAFGTVDTEGKVRIDHNWWLLLYNLCIQVLGTGNGLPADALIDIESTDTDAIDADAIALRQPIWNLQNDLPIPDVPDLAQVLLLAQDTLLADPPASAQPVSAITPGASPYTYTAPFNGQVSVTGGTVSQIQLIRQSTTVATGLTAGLIMVSRLDQVVVTYTGTPTMVFIPT
jgi:hypothetical protein